MVYNKKPSLSLKLRLEKTIASLPKELKVFLKKTGMDVSNKFLQKVF